jgi:hypothetical protein
VTEGLAPRGIVKPGDIKLPREPTVVGPMPRIGGGLSNFVEIELQSPSLTITLENPLLERYSLDNLSSEYRDGPRYVVVDLCFIADGAVMDSLGHGWPVTSWGGPQEKAILRVPRRQGEWLCIYCGSINSMVHIRCSQCGGARARDWMVT